ncbi:ornithine racemase Orr [Thermohalobacter berrensis]|nr:ornithine racemase Orr [Thermohalobacter berrensis]
MYPRVEINLEKIKHNTKVLVDKCKDIGIEVTGVTKSFCGIKEVAEAMVEGGISIVADSRIENLKKLKDIKLPKLLLRLPMLSQTEQVVQYADISLNSEMETIKKLSEKALEKGKVHKVILMIDLGDLREGIFKKEKILKYVNQIKNLKGVKLVGIGTNLTCYGGVIPSKENLSKLVDIKKEIEEKLDIKLEIISGGNSSSIHLIDKGEMPKEINNLRLGESIILGRETAYGNKIENTYDDGFRLVVEIIELKEKPSVPIGEIGMDAFGNKPTFEDKGIRKRAICAIGKQDIDIEDIIPEDKCISILGASSDHLILDVTECDKNFKVGDKISFKLTYGGVVKSLTSEYVSKIFI